MTTFFLDLEGGNDANDGTTFANRWKTFATGATAARTAPGDTIRVMQSADPASIGTGTWTNASGTVTLDNKIHQTIDECESAWTASSNVTATASSSVRIDGNSANLSIAAAFTTGKVAFRALPGTLNLSAFKGVSFWCRSTLALASGVLTLNLCSDGIGAVSVNTITIPALVAGEWRRVYVDTGGALGSAIASISLNAASDPGTVVVNLDNICAVNSVSQGSHVSLLTPIANSNVGDMTDEWYPIAAIKDSSASPTTTALILGGGMAVNGTAKYYGTGGNATTYARRTIDQSGVTMTINESGSNTSKITYSGGWNTTDMTTQTGDTWICKNGIVSSSGFQLGGLRQLAFERFSWLSCLTPMTFSSSAQDMTIDRMHLADVDVGVQFPTAKPYRCKWTNVQGMIVDNPVSVTSGATDTIVKGRKLVGTQTATVSKGIELATGCRRIDCEFTSIKGFASGISLSSSASGDMMTDIVVRNCAISDSVTQDIDLGLGQDLLLINCTYTTATFGGIQSRLYEQDAQGVAGDAKISEGTIGSSGWTWATATDQRHTASGKSWKFTAGAAIASGTQMPTSEFPASLPLAKVACNAGALVTISGWVRRTSTSTAVRLRVPAATGLSAEVTASASGSVDTWEQVTLSFTPTSAGVFELYGDIYGTAIANSCNVWFDDLTMSQV
jgi:hypothetical protein